jgi:hypothetical protein
MASRDLVEADAVDAQTRDVHFDERHDASGLPPTIDMCVTTGNGVFFVY